MERGMIMRHQVRGLAAGLALAVAFATAAFAPAGFAAEAGWDDAGVATLPAEHDPHWVWVGDISFFHMIDGRAYLVDADSGAFLGQLTTGGLFMHLNLPTTRNEIYSAGTYYSRGTYGTREDVLTIHDSATLSPVGEVVLPPKRHSGMPMEGYQALTDGERFLAVYNLTPAQSVTVVDLEARSVTAEIPTPGCALVYPDGERRFHQLCASGRLQTILLTENGELDASVQSEPFFDAQNDPITEKGVRFGDRWVHVSFKGDVYEIDTSGEAPGFAVPWSMLSDEDRSESWLPGGVQHLASHEGSDRLFSLMHQGVWTRTRILAARSGSTTSPPAGACSESRSWGSPPPSR